MKAFSRSVKKLLLSALLLFYLGASWVGAIHLHGSDEHHHADCKVCHILKTFQSAGLPPQAIHSDFDAAAFETIRFLPSLCDRVAIKGFFSQAPPSLR